jgi:beta-galactosidase GanA
MFLHGCGIMDYWWWPEDMNEFYDSSMKHSHLISLKDVDTVMKAALDIRRLPKYIVPFSYQKNEFSILYSRASLIQKYPEAKGVKTPYALETEKTYEAAVRLDTPVGFSSSKRIRDGIPKETKVLVIPGVKYMEGDIYEKIKDWCTRGKIVVITPSSLVADQFGRKRNYLDDLGIEVQSEELPEYLAGENKPGLQQTGEFSFIQGPVVKTIISKEPKVDFETDKADIFKQPVKMSAAGTIQTVKPAPDWKILAKTADGNPMIMKKYLGRGSVYYLAAQLDVPSRKALFDLLIDKAGINRAIRTSDPDGVYVPEVESRTVKFEDGLLTYLHNTAEKEFTIKLNAGKKEIVKITWLNAEKDLTGDTVTVAPYETKLLKITLK